MLIAIKLTVRPLCVIKVLKYEEKMKKHLFVIITLITIITIQGQENTFPLTGNVGIGTNTPGEYKLAVNGKIKTKEVNVTLEGWSDFVFNEGY